MNGSETSANGSNAKEERALVSRAQKGDSTAFEALYRAAVSGVLGLCTRMTGDPVRGRELAHDTFVKAWETLHTFRGDSTFASWVHRLALNIVLQDSRTTRRREARVSLTSDHSTINDAAVGGIDTPAQLELDDALRRLSDDYRRIVTLHDIEGYRHDEIATLLGVASGTVRARLHHARKQLREWMKA